MLQIDATRLGTVARGIVDLGAGVMRVCVFFLCSCANTHVCERLCMRQCVLVFHVCLCVRLRQAQRHANVVCSTQTRQARMNMRSTRRVI